MSDTEPTDDNVDIWIDTSEEGTIAISDEVIISSTKPTDGNVDIWIDTSSDYDEDSGKDVGIFGDTDSFPAVGEPAKIYIDKTNKLPYFYNTDTNTYEPLGSKPTTSSPQGFTITVSDWVDTNIGGYSYYADIHNTGTSENDCADIMFSFESLEICQDAEIAPSGVVNDDSIRLYCKNIPDSNISGSYIIYKGAV